MSTPSEWATTPAGVPPPGVTPNFVDPPSIGYQVTVCNAICGVIVYGIILLRFYTRWGIQRSLGADDYVAAVQLVTYAGYMASFQFGVNHGLGRHAWNVTLADFSPYFLQSWLIDSVFYSTNMMLAKLTILLFYRRLFPIKNFRVRWWIVTFITVGYSVAGILCGLFACLPVASSWDIRIHATTCLDKNSFYIANGVLNVISDVLVLLLPIPIVWGLSLSTRQRINVIIVFALGSATCIISIIRLKILVVLLASSTSTTDSTYALVSPLVWSQIEVTTAIFCGAVPTLKAFLQRHFSSLFPENSTGHTTGRYYTTGTKPSRGPADPARNFELDHRKNLSMATCRARDPDSESTDQIISHSRSNDRIVVSRTYHVSTAE